MAAIPGTVVASTAATTAAASTLTAVSNFVVSVGASYLLGRLGAQDGPRLGNLSAAGGEYGVGMPRAYGEVCRLTGIFIAQADIKETKHKIEDYSEIAGVLTGASAGFLLGGPIGAGIGAVLGGILGSAIPNQHYYTYSDTFALLLADRDGQNPIEGITKVYASGKLLFSASASAVVSETFGSDGRLKSRKYGKNRYFASLTIYAGHDEQGVDPILSSLLGETSAYPRTAYAVIDELQLAQWGNSVPSQEFLTQVATGQTLADIEEEFCLRAGMDPVHNVSTTALVSKVCRGYVLTAQTSCWDATKPLLGPFASDCGEVAGQLRFYKRTQSMRATIPLDDMGAYVYGDNPPLRYTFNRNPDIALPQETSLTFIDPARDYQPNTQSYSRSEGDASSNISTSLELVLTADEGAKAAALMLWDAWLGRTPLAFTLTDAWIGLDVGLAYAIPVKDDQHVPFRILRKTRGANGIIEVEAVSDENVAYTPIVTGTSGTPPIDEPTTFAETRLILIDGAITADFHDDYGFYTVIGGTETYWDRGKVQASLDGTDFVTVLDSNLGCPAMGDVTGILTAGLTTGLDDTLDTTSVLTVILLHDGMELENATDAELDDWKNFCFVGKDGIGEYIQFKTATKVAAATWELTDLRRGRKGSDWALGAHVADEEFALLGLDGFFRSVYTGTDQWGVPLFFRGVSLHQDEADAAIINFTNTGEGKRPYSPVNVMGSWDGSNNLTIAWDSRSRLNAGGLGIDDQFNFEVEILTGAGRTIMATGVESATYSAADQTTDTITPGDSITGRVRQLSDVNDGRWRDFFLAGPGALLLELEDDATPLELEDGITPFELG